MSTDGRIGSLSSILSSSPSRRAPVTPLKPVADRSDKDPEPSAGESGAERPAAASPKPAPKAKAARPAATAQVHRRVVCRVLQDSHDRLAAHARSHNISHGAVVLQAVEKAHTDGVFAPEHRARPTGSGLFVGANAAQMRPAAARVILDVRLHHQDVEILDRLVVEHGLKDRTELINQALGHFLAGNRDR